MPIQGIAGGLAGAALAGSRFTGLVARSPLHSVAQYGKTMQSGPQVGWEYRATGAGRWAAKGAALGAGKAAYDTHQNYRKKRGSVR